MVVERAGVSDEARRSFPAALRAPRAAREWAAGVVAGWRVSGASLVTLVLNELVTNAVLHGRPPISVDLRRRDGGVWIGVSDSGHGQVARTWPGPGATGGRGLGIVAEASARWGVTPLPGRAGKTVWAEVGDPAAGT
ncbi:MAG TPA: ATP-binding protein [Acidimicrobiales bacterium]|nr:ATP-binding protein [Acidimicrobiales bacterium]